MATFVMYFHFSDVFPHISQRLSLVDGKDSDILCGLYFEEKAKIQEIYKIWSARKFIHFLPEKVYFKEALYQMERK